MKAIQCDRCSQHERREDALSSTVAHAMIDHILASYPEEYDLCTKCAKEWETLLRALRAYWPLKNDSTR